MNKVVISSLDSVINLMKSNPKLMTLPALQSLRNLVNQPAKASCCGSKPDYSAYRLAFETALRSLTEEQKKQMKTILNADQVVYFVKSKSSQIEKRTF